MKYLGLTARSEARILGSLRSVGGKGAVRMEDRFDTDIEDLAAHLVGGERCDAQARCAELQPAYEDLAASLS